MKRLLFAGALAFVAAGQALAADLPPPAAPPPRAPAAYVPTIVPVYNWTGFYIGGNAGYAFASNLSSTGCITNNTGNGLASPPIPVLNGCGTIAGSSASGFAGGGQIGANVQWNALVLGLEGDWDYSGQQVTQTGPSFTGTVKLPWFATARARVGVAADRVLFYATGGAAWIDVNPTINSTGTQWFNVTNTQIGWTAGAGVEWAFAQNWTARAEYLFMDFSPSWTGTIPATFGNGTLSENATIKNNVIRGGINFKFP
jgi:outer membrane immunogenic protein